ncbi:unnamed protein product, partial [Staurois parvus]
MPPVSVHQCKLPKPISATSMPHISQMLPISDHQCCLSVPPISAAYQCQSVPPISAIYECC